MNQWLIALAVIACGLPAHLTAQVERKIGTETFLGPRAVEVEKAVNRGLAYLAAQQRPNGTFPGYRGKSCGIVSLAGMSFLSKGYTPGFGPYGRHINLCVDYVLKNQKPNGVLNNDEDDKGMYSHNIATLFLSEISGMVSPDRQIRLDRVLAKAMALSLQAQRLGEKAQRYTGGWRYEADSPDSDLSCSGWAIMSLRSCRLNGGRVPDEAIRASVQYIMRNHDREVGSFGYTDARNNSVTLSGAGLLCLELCGHHGAKETIAAGEFLLREHKEIADEHFAYYGVYYAAQGMFQLGGKYWNTFSKWMVDEYLPMQRVDGSWEHDRKGESIVYYTSMMLLSLTVPYRQLPIYQRDESVD